MEIALSHETDPRSIGGGAGPTPHPSLAGRRSGHVLDDLLRLIGPDVNLQQFWPKKAPGTSLQVTCRLHVISSVAPSSFGNKP
ncbi:hypothetical protein DPV78_005673 [Talaromyces pinophilus]|jgi:hypothetical protein|nr:hypothetical protein DPV78_005673 [Talaromyces pinophilus]